MCNINKKEKIRKVFTDDLPRWTEGNHKGMTRWSESIGYIVKFIYDEIKGEVEILSYNNRILSIKYLDKEPFKIETNNFMYCKLGTLLGKRTKDFKIQIGDTFKDQKRDLSIISREYRKNNRKWYQYKCNVCGWCDDRSWMTEGDLFSKNGCSCCHNLTVVEHINSVVAKTETQWMIPYFEGGYDEAKLYTPSSNVRLCFKCPDCNHIKTKPISINQLHQRNSIGCVCGDGFSYGHKYIYSLLSQLNLQFKENYKFDWCVFSSYTDKNKQTSGEYDFVIEKIKLIIEVDGDFHRKDNTINGQTKKESEYLDDMKDIVGKENRYNVIRISDEDSFKYNILNSKLNELFNLSVINWNKAEEFAISNRVKEICIIKKNNQNMTTYEISEKTGICRDTITKYLKQGTLLNWCYYDAKEEKSRSSSRAGKKNRKEVEIFKDGISLGVFKSCIELSKVSMDLFGLNLLKDKIACVARGERKIHKGFTFQYI